MNKNFQKNTLKPRCTLPFDSFQSLRVGSDNTVYAVRALQALAHIPLQQFIVKYGCSGTSHILKR